MNIELGVLVTALISIVHVLGAITVTLDAVLRKRHVSSVIGWIGLAWLAPIIGSIAYLCLGINRIKRKAASLYPRRTWAQATVGSESHAIRGDESQAWLEADALASQHPAMVGLARLGTSITGIPLTDGNLVEPLVDGDQAFPAMLAAIDHATTSLTLASYIFDNDATGQLFLAALCDARDRGVEVRVLIDDVGARYSRPSMLRLLARARIPAAPFLPTRAPRLFQYANLRNHRKIMVADGQTGFIGGTNIRHGHWLGKRPPYPTRCLHFRIEGPVVEDLQHTFAVDWAFTTGEQLRGETWFPPLPRRGPVMARGVSDGPDEDIDKILELMLGALSVATRSVRVMTPYFVIEGALAQLLQVTAMRGVAVDILLPAQSNLPLIDWATAPQLPLLLEHGCRIHRSPAPFDHSKAMVVDGIWSLIGSSNWDTRSLRLNFEYNVECYDSHLAAALEALIDRKIAAAHELTLDDVQAWSFGLRLRNGLARLLTPYI
jgi:cardiolipin synthase A/B